MGFYKNITGQKNNLTNELQLKNKMLNFAYEEDPQSNENLFLLNLFLMPKKEIKELGSS